MRVALLQSSRGILRAHSLRLTSNLLSSNMVLNGVVILYVRVSRWRNTKSTEEEEQTTRPERALVKAVKPWRWVRDCFFRVWLKNQQNRSREKKTKWGFEPVTSGFGPIKGLKYTETLWSAALQILSFFDRILSAKSAAPNLTRHRHGKSTDAPCHQPASCSISAANQHACLP